MFAAAHGHWQIGALGLLLTLRSLRTKKNSDNENEISLHDRHLCKNSHQSCSTRTPFPIYEFFFFFFRSFSLSAEPPYPYSVLISPPQVHLPPRKESRNNGSIQFNQPLHFLKSRRLGGKKRGPNRSPTRTRWGRDPG